jgi:hypothetical protein
VRPASPDEATTFRLVANTTDPAEDIVLAYLVRLDRLKTGRENDRGISVERDQIRTDGGRRVKSKTEGGLEKQASGLERPVLKHRDRGQWRPR